MAVLRFCAEEVRRQGRGPLETVGMIEAWNYAARLMDRGKRLSAEHLQMFGNSIEPEKNSQGRWRDCNVRVGSHVAPGFSEVPGLMARYLEMFPSMDPEEAYLEFERIHPFRDGNGRVGKIIFNWAKRTLAMPVWPPNFWGNGNP